MYEIRYTILMPLHEQIKTNIKEAMKARDEIRLSTLRCVLSAFTNEIVAQKKRPDELLADTDALKVIKRLANQRKDSIEQFTKGGRPELAESEQKELAVLEKFLPAMMSEAEIRAIAEAKKAELGITDKAKIGQLTGMIMKELAGKADGADVKKVVDSLF